ncbi:DUF1439 domain-containing protein [Methylophilus sp. 5]|uniref:DUF1439 domain-containing protein n=1 Tax=Methylophilus sp. 5 TaxID=1112274 RepID=UPI0004BC0653|nr:DUF1439 domain-containing protein [Methylophilus sp. 5]
MRVLKNFCGVVLLALSLTHCATMGERTVKMNTAQLQQKLNNKLAKPLTVLKVFHIQLSNALVSMDPASGRIHTLMDASVQSDLLSNAATGKLGLSGLVKFDPARNAVVLDQPAVDSFQLDGAHSEWNGLVQQLAKDLGGKWLNQLVLYEVKPEDLSYAGRHYQPGDLQVTADGLQVTLKPQ